MLFDGRPIRNVASLLRSVESELKRKRARTSPLWFRGCTDRDHSLVPSIGRPPYQLEHERPLINAFKQNAVQFLEHRPQTHWEWIFLARHHTVPTRLLDWTERFVAVEGQVQLQAAGQKLDAALTLPVAVAEGPEHGGGVSAQGHGVRG